MAISIAQLVSAIKKLASEANAGLRAQHIRDIVNGVEQIGHRLAELENRVAKLESKKL